MGKKACNVSVKLGGKVKSSEQLIRIFLRLCKREGIIKECKDRSFYVPKGERRRKKRHAAKMRHKKNNNKK